MRCRCLKTPWPMDPSFALAYAACANACAMFYCNYSREAIWVERARNASGKAVALRWDLPEVQVSQAWVLYATELHDEAVRMVRKAIERKKDCEGAYYLLCRALFSAGRYQEVVDVTGGGAGSGRRRLQRVCADMRMPSERWGKRRVPQ